MRILYYRLYCVPFFDFFLIHNTHDSWRMSNQEVANSRVLRNSITSLSPFPFKACSGRITDFHFLSSHKFSEKILAAISLRCIGCWQTAKQTSRQIEFWDAFKTKIGSFPVGAAIISHFFLSLLNLSSFSRLLYIISLFRSPSVSMRKGGRPLALQLGWKADARNLTPESRKMK